MRRGRDKQNDDDGDDDDRNWIYVKDSTLLSVSTNIKGIVGSEKL